MTTDSPTQLENKLEPIQRAKSWLADYDSGKLTASDLYTRCLIMDLLKLIDSRAPVVAPQEDALALKKLSSRIGDVIEESLRSYRCQYTRELPDLENGLALVDLLTPEPDTDVTRGLQELELLADYIASDVDDELKQFAPAPSSPVPAEQKPIDMILFCPRCGTQHVDAPESDRHYRARLSNAMPAELAPQWTNPPHKSHLCHSCRLVWRPADVPTNGVAQITTRGKEDNTWTNSVAVPATPSLAAREAAEEIAAIAAEDPTRSRLLSVAFKQRVTDTIVSRFNCSPVPAAANHELRSVCCDAPTRTANTDYNVCTACKEPCDTNIAVPAAGGDEDQRPSCWHCGVILAYAPKLRCEDCPDECDKEGCDELGCAGSREYHELRCARWVSVDADRVRYDRTVKCTCAVQINGASSTPKG